MQCENRQNEKDGENQNKRKRRKQKEIKGEIERKIKLLKLIRKLLKHIKINQKTRNSSSIDRKSKKEIGRT